MTRSLQNAPYRGIKFHLHEADDNNDEMLVWSFCCVYNSKTVSQECAKAYLSELVSITDNRAYTLLAFVPGGVDPFRPTVI